MVVRQTLLRQIQDCSQTVDRPLTLVPRFAAVLALAVVSILVTACGSATTTEAAAEAKKDVQSEYDKSGRLSRLTYDRDGDGKIDTWGYMDGSRVVRVEVDEDGDGKVDRWEYHRDPKTTNSSTGSTGSRNAGSAREADDGDPTVERIDRATKHDGKVSRHEYFDNGVLTRIEEDTD